jgi:hypothetical protein
MGMSRSRPAAPLEPAGTSLEARLRTARALVARHRRLAAAVCAGGAVLAAVSALSPAPMSAAGGAAGPGNASLAVSLPAGAGDRPAATAGRVAVTVRLADPAGLLLLRTGAHVEVVGGAPAGAAAVTGGAGDVEVLAADAVVLAVPQPTSAGVDSAVDPGAGAGLLGGTTPPAGQGVEGVLVLSVVPADAHRLAGAAGTRPLSVAVALPPP